MEMMTLWIRPLSVKKALRLWWSDSTHLHKCPTISWNDPKLLLVQPGQANAAREARLHGLRVTHDH
jgi:hypothetical protein